MITYPLNNIDYTAEDAELFHCTRNSGIWAKDSFSISVTGFDNNIAIGTGIAWINNEKFSGKVAALKSAKTLDLGIADSAYPRIDVIAIQFNANNNATDIVVKKGVASTNPTRPAISRTATVYELYLASIYRPAASTVVTANNVTDLRLDESVCGLMSDSVTKIDTGAINAQVLALVGSLNAAIESVKNASGIMLTSDYDPDNNRVFAVSNGGTGAKTPAGARTNLGLDDKVFVKYARDTINIDSTDGNWSTDITDTSHGTIPVVGQWVNVTQHCGSDFKSQIAISCDPVQHATGRTWKMWIRDKWHGGVWSNWIEVLTEKNGIQMKKLWTNPSPNDTFGSLSSISLSPVNVKTYDFIEISYYYAGARDGVICTERVMVLDDEGSGFEGILRGKTCTREMYFSTYGSTMSFANAVDSSNATKNGQVVPLAVYGIKGVL